MKQKVIWISAAMACFALHFGLVFHHVYVTASHHGQRPFPLPSPAFLQENHTALPTPWHPVLDLNRWDSAHYELIATHGYRSKEAEARYFHPIMWYPGYPLMAGLVQRVTGLSTTFVFSILSLFFTLTFWVLLWSPAVTGILGRKPVAIASILLIVWPGSYYFFSGMTEPLVSLLLLACLTLWFQNRPISSAAVLALGSGVKQLFVPVALAIYGLNLLKERPNPVRPTLLFLLSISGFLCFGLYGALYYDNFFASSDTCLRMFGKSLSLLSLVDIGHYARCFWKINGITAFAGMALLVGMIPFVFKAFPDRAAVVAFFKNTRETLPVPLSLWWVALAMTAFFTLGDAHGVSPYMSMLRFQTTNIPFFLLVGTQLRHHPWPTLCFMLVPLGSLFLVWQRSFTILYWGWRWIA